MTKEEFLSGVRFQHKEEVHYTSVKKTYYYTRADNPVSLGYISCITSELGNNHDCYFCGVTEVNSHSAYGFEFILGKKHEFVFEFEKCIKAKKQWTPSYRY
jgi:hypothetical protein